jgi:hypothetical protein
MLFVRAYPQGILTFGTALAHEASERLALLSSVDIPLIYN